MPAYDATRGNLHFRCTPGVAIAIETIARYRHQTPSDFIRQAIRSAIIEESEKAWQAVVQYDAQQIDQGELSKRLKHIVWDNPFTYGFVPTEDGPPTE